MSAAPYISRLPGVSNDELATINALLAQLHQHKRRNLLRQSYYDSKRAVRMVGSLVPPQYYRLGLVLGWCGKSVDLLGRRCALDGFTWSDGKLEDLGAYQILDDTDVLSEVAGAINSALIHGPAFLVNIQGEDGEPAGQIHAKDALSSTGQWNKRTQQLDSLLSIIDEDDEGQPTELALYLYNRTITATKVGYRWQANVQDHSWGMTAERVLYRPNGANRLRRPFGSSRITRPLMGLQDAAVRTLIRLEGHMDVYSNPEFWMLGADETVFRNADGTQKDVFAVRLGRIKGIPDDEEATQPRADVKQFPASDPTPQLADLNALAKLAAREASLPDSSLAITDVSNPTSAESYDASQYELIAEAEGTTRDASPAVRRAFVRQLAMANGIGGIAEIPSEWSSIKPKWRNPRYVSRAAEADAGMKQITAVPWLAESEVGLELLGLGPDQIRRALADRRRAAGRAIAASLNPPQDPKQAPSEPVVGSS
jgi:hypothetical protein